MRQMLASYLVNAAWQVPVVAFCALIISRFGGLSPRDRNCLWLAFLGLAAILPAVSLSTLLPHIPPSVARVAIDAPVDAHALAALHAVPAADPAVSLPSWSVWTMTALFTVVALALMARLAVAASAARQLVRQSRGVDLSADIMQAVESLAHTHNRRAPAIRSSARVSSPAVVGAFKPVILIPKGMAPNGDDLRAALLHETAHVVRNDYAINLVCELLTLPVSWHPALLALKTGVRRSRELACDDMAAEAMGSPKAYAKRLISLAQSLGATCPTAADAPSHAALAVGLFGRSDLEERLMQLMKPKDAEGPAIRAARLCSLAAVGVSLLGSAALLHVTPVFAQTAALSAPATNAGPATKAGPASALVTPTLVDQTAAAASKPQARHRRAGLIFSKDGAIIETGPAGYRHSFTTADGRPITVTTDDPKEPSAEQQRLWDDEARKAEAKAADIEKMINSPEFKAQIERAQARAAEAEKMVNSPEFKARIAKAVARAADAEKLVNSPEFKTRTAKAQARAAEAQAMINSPEFKERIARIAREAADRAWTEHGRDEPHTDAGPSNPTP